MDLLGDNPPLNLSDRNFRIYSRNSARPPQFVGARAVVSNSRISEGCRIYGHVENSVLSGGVVVEEGAVVKDSVIMEDVVICKNAQVYTSIVDSDSVIGEACVVGKEDAGKGNITIVAKGTHMPTAQM